VLVILFIFYIYYYEKKKTKTTIIYVPTFFVDVHIAIHVQKYMFAPTGTITILYIIILYTTNVMGYIIVADYNITPSRRRRYEICLEIKRYKNLGLLTIYFFFQ
jgi:hypothetical protein